VTQRSEEREVVHINPLGAHSRGISNTDVVRLFNDRGHTLAAAQITKRVRLGVADRCLV
jgi:anaerobic selenocysteine-containing dehydrogenase